MYSWCCDWLTLSTHWASLLKSLQTKYKIIATNAQLRCFWGNKIEPIEENTHPWYLASLARAGKIELIWILVSPGIGWHAILSPTIESLISRYAAPWRHPALASTSTVSNYIPAAGHRKIMRRESQKVGLCSAQVISQPEHFTQLNPGAIVHNLSFISGKTPAALCTIHCIHFGQFRAFLYNISKYCSQVSYSREWVNRITFVVRHSWRFSFSLLYQIQFAV